LEAQRFSQNASEMLLERCQLVEFLKSLGCELHPSGDVYKAVCPVCKDSSMYIGTNGTYHKIYWGCYSKECPTKKPGNKFVANLLGLVRALRPEGSQVAAMKTIAAFLGVRHSFDITNRKRQASATCEEFPPF
jgi:hypothetical protein